MKKNNMNTSILEKRSFSWTSWKSSNLQLISSYLIQRSKSLVNLFFKTLTSSQPQILLTIWGVDFNSPLLLHSTLHLLMVTQLTLALFIMELTAQHNIKQSSIRFGKLLGKFRSRLWNTQKTGIVWKHFSGTRRFPTMQNKKLAVTCMKYGWMMMTIKSKQPSIQCFPTNSKMSSISKQKANSSNPFHFFKLWVIHMK